MESLCVFCVHMSFEYENQGCPTCGYGTKNEMLCDKQHWTSDVSWSLTDYRDKIVQAQSCIDYKQVE